MPVWSKVKVADVADKKRWALNGGPFGSKLSTKHYRADGVPVIRGVNLSGPTLFRDSEFVYVDEKTADELLSNNAHPNDLVFTQRGTIGQVGLIPTKARFTRYVISQSQMKLTPDPSKADALYLYYYFSAPSVVSEIKNLAFAAGVPHINLEILRNFEISLPPLRVQQRIRSILSAYDDLIENNLRRIRILEEMASSLYREWFVNFRFPGHDRAIFVDSPAGRLPEGWTMKKIKEVSTVNRNQLTERTAPPQINYIDISSVTVGRIETITPYPFEEAPGRARRIVRHGDVLWSCVRPNRRSYALALHPTPNTIASTGFAVLSSTLVPYTYLYHATTTEDFVAYLTNHATGAAYPAVSAGTFEEAEILLPDAKILARFEVFANPSAEQIHTLEEQSSVLRHTRDLLLPRLLSGKINLEDVDAAA